MTALGRDVQVTSNGTQELLHICFWVYIGYRFVGFVVKPVRYVLAGVDDYGITEWTLPVFLYELGQVEYLVELRNPAVIFRVVLCHLRGQIVSPQLVLRWHVF